MITAPKFYGEVKGGQLGVYDRVGFMQYLSNLMGKVEIIVRYPFKYRTSLENRYFHGVICPAVADKLYELGLIGSPDPLIAKEILKAMFLKQFVEINGKQVI